MKKTPNIIRTNATIDRKKFFQDYFNKESTQYLSRRDWMYSYVFRRITSHLIHWMRNSGKGCWVLNVGSGPGFLERCLKDRFTDFNYVALDISLEMARLTKSTAPWLDVVLADAEALPFKTGSFEVILSSRAIKFFNVPKFLNEANEILSDEGSIGIIFDCGDALWIRAIELLGKKIDNGNQIRTLRSYDLKTSLCEAGFNVSTIAHISMLPQSLFSHVPSSLFPILKFIDKPAFGNRIAFIASSKEQKPAP